jgi:hypothetical protein
MRALYYIGLDIHKKMIAYCIKALDGLLLNRARLAQTRGRLHNG